MYETCIKSEENNVAWYTMNCVEKLMVGVQQTNMLNCDYSKQKKEYKQEK